MRLKWSWFVPAMMLATANCASPSPPPQTSQSADPLSPQIMKFATSPAHDAAVRTVATDTFNRLWDCPSSTAAPLIKLRTYGQVSFSDGGEPISGVIIESVAVSGCGNTKLQNVLTVASAGQPLKIVTGMPGTTLADPVLVHDTLPYVHTAVAVKRSCSSVRFVDSDFGRFEGPANPKAKYQQYEGRDWSEAWTVNACGTLLPVVVHYHPNETGTGIYVPVN